MTLEGDRPDTNEEGREGGDGKMALMDHLIELRNRVVISVVALIIGFAVAYYFAPEIYGFLVAPLAAVMEGETSRRMIYTGLAEAFITYLKVAFYTGLFLAFPVIASQLWIFVAPGLYRNERRAFLPFLVATPLLFLAGAALAYYVIFPLAWDFFLNFETPAGPGGLAIELEAKVNEYLGLVIKLILAFGISFQLPVLLTLMARAGLVTADGLSRRRKYAVVIVFMAAAILTPPDIISQIGLAIPILLLYEASIVVVRTIERRGARVSDNAKGEKP